MLEICNLNKAYGAPVIKDFSYHFSHKGLFLVRGPSGSGKTTLLRLIAGLEKPDSGQILWTRDHQISMVFQEARLVPHLTLLDNVLLVKQEKDQNKALSLLERFGLLSAAGKKPEALSGGMKLRGAIVRSLYYGGDIFLWDEPTKELDPENRNLVFQVMQEVAKKALLIAVTHDQTPMEGTVISLEQ